VGSEKSAISLSLKVCAFQPGLAANRAGQELGPTQPSLRSPTAIMITCSNSPVLGSGMPNHYIGDLLHTIAISGLSRVRTELMRLTVIAALAPHPYRCTASFLAMATLAIFRPRRMARWKKLRLPGSPEFSMVPILVRRRLLPPVQLFQPFSQFIPAGSASHTVLTVGAVDSQKEQCVADLKSQVLNEREQLLGISLFRSLFVEFHPALLLFAVHWNTYSEVKSLLPSRFGCKYLSE